jgi:ribosomal protein S8E
MEEVSKTISEMQLRIASKLRAAGANSKEKAITAQEANFDVPEQNWLNYIAGGLFALVKKTQDKRYYVRTFY